MIFEKVRTRPNGKSVKAVSEALPNGKLQLTVESGGKTQVLTLDPLELDCALKSIGGLSAKGWKGLNG